MSWRTVRLGELVENFSVRAKDVGGAEGLDFYGVSNEEGIIKTKYAAEDKAEDYKIIEKGCFAYNPYRVNVGSIGLVSEDTRGLISPAYVVFKPKPKSIIPELLFKFLKSDEGLRQIIFYARGTVRQALRFEDLCNIEISIPDYAEQQGLYNKLINSQKSSTLLDAELKNQLELLKKLRQQLLQDAVEGRLVEQNKKDEPASELLKKIKSEKETLRKAQGKTKKNPSTSLRAGKELPPIKHEEIPFEIPENWVWCRLGDTVILKRGKSKHRPRNDASLFEGGIHPFIQTGDVARSKANGYLIETINGHYNDFGLSQSLMQKKGTLCITIAANIAECGFLGFDACAPDSIVCVNAIDQIIEKYCFYYIIQAREDIEKYAPATAQKNINLEILNSLLIPLPPLIEQNRIVQKLDELMQYCNDLEASIKQSESQNEKLLQQVLREALRKPASKAGKEPV